MQCKQNHVASSIQDQFRTWGHIQHPVGRHITTTQLQHTSSLGLFSNQSFQVQLYRSHNSSTATEGRNDCRIAQPGMTVSNKQCLAADRPHRAAARSRGRDARHLLCFQIPPNPSTSTTRKKSLATTRSSLSKQALVKGVIVLFTITTSCCCWASTIGALPVGGCPQRTNTALTALGVKPCSQGTQQIRPSVKQLRPRKPADIYRYIQSLYCRLHSMTRTSC